MPQELVQPLLDALKPYEHNRNTGVSYEIATILWIARTEGLNDTQYRKIAECVTGLAERNPKGREQILRALKTYETYPRGQGVEIDGHPLTGLRNVTQDDSDGSTGDLVLTSTSGAQASLSIFSGNPTILKKCLKNPSCRGFGCNDDDVAYFKKLASDAAIKYEAEMRQKHGDDTSAWKRRRSEAAIEACTSAAQRTETRFNSLPATKRKQLFTSLLSLNENGLPCDYLAIVDDNMLPHFFNVSRNCTDTTQLEPSLRAHGVFLMLSRNAQESPLVRVQVKFNNGIKSPLHSSWNAVASLDAAFNIVPVTLVKGS